MDVCLSFFCTPWHRKLPQDKREKLHQTLHEFPWKFAQLSVSCDLSIWTQTIYREIFFGVSPLCLQFQKNSPLPFSRENEEECEFMVYHGNDFLCFINGKPNIRVISALITKIGKLIEKLLNLCKFTRELFESYTQKLRLMECELL